MAEENKAMELHGEESEKKKYISDVLDIDKLIEKYGNKIMLTTPVNDNVKFENNNSMSLQQFAEVLHVYAIATGNIHLTEQGKKLLKK